LESGENRTVIVDEFDGCDRDRVSKIIDFYECVL
jgi:uncharacterized protein (DUF433 family)